MKGFRIIVLLFCLFSLSLVACGGQAGEPVAEVPGTVTVAETPTEEPATPTAEPSPTATEPVATGTPAPTNTPRPTSTPAPTRVPATPTAPPVVLALETRPFSHPDGLFSLQPPRGWTAESNTGAASFAAPDDSGFIYAQVTNTGYALDAASFERFVNGRETNFFDGYDGYVEIDRQINIKNGVATVTKSLLFDGIRQTVVTLYDQHDLAVYTFDFWADEELFEAYSVAYDQIIESIMVNVEAAATQEPYYWIYTFTGPRDLFTIDVPSPWRYERSESDVIIVDTFYSPDEHAVIQNIAYDDGSAVSRSQAGAFALELLRTYYAQDIRITDDRVQPDGSERLTWNSRSGDYSGISFFESRGTTFLLFTIMYDNPHEDLYFDVFDYTIGSYAVP